ncbi:MAG: ParA family protein [Deltaproteobacteria bacterium]|nr:ParA family protein [Deltaproteobacteria bacterium]
MSLAEKLKDLLTVEKSHYDKGTLKAKVISICSQKGGVGKTTTTVNLGSGLTLFHNKKVLLIDLDAQGHVEKSLGELIDESAEYTPLSQILASKHGELLDGIVKTKIDNLDITPGDRELTSSEAVISQRIGREFILKQSLEVARTLYDYIVIDCPPALGNLTLNALCASDYVILPCEMSALAFEGVNGLIEMLEEIKERLNQKLKLLGVLFTRVDHRNVTMNELIVQNMKKFVNGQLLKTSIAVNTAINKAQLNGVPIFQYASSSTGAENYQALAVEILKRMRGTSVNRSQEKNRPLAQSA